jgi:hypothetical protein
VRLETAKKPLKRALGASVAHELVEFDTGILRLD